MKSEPNVVGMYKVELKTPIKIAVVFNNIDNGIGWAYWNGINFVGLWENQPNKAACLMAAEGVFDRIITDELITDWYPIKFDSEEE